MGLSREFMSEIYGKMSNEELISAATNDIKDLTPEALEALQQELTLRGLRSRVDNAVKVQQKVISAEEFCVYVDLVRQLPCPVCLKTDKLLNGAVLAKIATAIVFSSTHREFIIACPDCLKQAINNSGSVSMSLDFVGIIKGVIQTAKVIMENKNSLSQVKAEAPSDSLLYFVKKKIGEIELYRDDKTKLEELINYANATFF